MHAVPRNWRKVLVVTSAFHMGRTRAAFEWVWSLYAPGADGAGLTEEQQREKAGGEPYIAMDFAVTPDDGLNPEVGLLHSC
jgi:hypothetical protein